MTKRRKITNPDELERIRARRKLERLSAAVQEGLRSQDRVGDFNEFLYGVRDMQHSHRLGWIPMNQRNYP